MYALYFNDADGGRAFIAAVDDKHSALSMAKLLSRQDPRDVVVIENRAVGDTMLAATYRRGALQIQDVDPSTLGRSAPPAAGADANPPPKVQ
jgi:hypothetical protein